MPEAAPLAALRRDIDRKPHRIKAVLTDTAMRKEFFGGIGRDEKKAIRAFAGHNSRTALKTKPKVSLHLIFIHQQPQLIANATHGKSGMPIDDLISHLYFLNFGWETLVDVLSETFAGPEPAHDHAM